MTEDDVIRLSQATYEALSAADGGLKREVLTHRSLGIVHTLGWRGD